MGADARLDVMFGAFGVAMKGIAGQLDPQDVADLVTRAEELLGSAAPEARAVMAFATQYELHRQDPARVADLSKWLRHQLEVLMQAPPVDAGRADIHG